MMVHKSLNTFIFLLILSIVGCEFNATSKAISEPHQSNSELDSAASVNSDSHELESDQVVGEPTGNIEVPSIPADNEIYFPSDLLPNYRQWKITLPDGFEHKDILNFSNEYFFVNSAKTGIVFKAPIKNSNGSTPNSKYIRSELRERTEDGESDIFWTTQGKHVIYVKQAITHLPIVKPHLVATQIHGDKSEGIDDAMVLRLEGEDLFLSFNGGKLRPNVPIVTSKNDHSSYKLGTVHEVIFEVIDGKHRVFYGVDGKLGNLYLKGNPSEYKAYGVRIDNSSILMDLNYGKSYFKIGNYTQSNPDTEDSYTDNPENYGEVVIYDHWVYHGN